MPPILCPTKEQTCFVAGTLVHTKEGLRPIEDIKVGDYVLSKPESGEGQLAYKRITRTYAFDDKEIWLLHYGDLCRIKGKLDPNLTGKICGTGDHPFWVVGIDNNLLTETDVPLPSWVELQNIKPGMLFQLHDGRVVYASFPYRLIATKDKDVAWYNLQNGDPREGYETEFTGRAIRAKEHGEWEACVGEIKSEQGESILRLNKSYYDHHTGEHDYDKYRNDAAENWFKPSDVPLFKRKVYNLEVEDYHTYFVAQQGIWVHNANYGGTAK